MTTIRVLLAVLIIIGFGLFITQNLWVPSLVAAILDHEERAAIVHPGAPMPPVATSTTSTVKPKPIEHPSAKGVVEGKVLLSPICPVEHTPPDPNCAPKGYQTTIRIASAGSASVTAASDASGFFTVSLDPGTYTVTAGTGSSIPPTCRSTQVTVAPKSTQTITIECDTGIR